MLLLFISCKESSKVYEDSKVFAVENKYQDSLNLLFESEYQKGHLPGFCLSIFSADSIYFMKGYGYADTESKKPFNENTVQNIASISKTLISIALMKAIEDGHMKLDDPINSILPFKVTNPVHQDVDITLRHLATHTSSISDDGNYKRAYIFSEPLKKEEFQDAWAEHIAIYNTNEDMNMEQYLTKVFEESSTWNITSNYLSHKPGSAFDYSNIGAALLAYCIELKTGIDYKQYTKDLILKPLKMNRSGWSLDNIKDDNHVVYYNESYNPVPPYKVITYPDGGLYSTVSELTMYLQEMMKGYQGKGTILNAGSSKEMMTNQIPDLDSPTGVIWDMDNTCCIGHGGNDFGVSTMMYFNPDTGIGKVLFSNISIEMEEQGDQFYTIFNDMFKYDSNFQ